MTPHHLHATAALESLHAARRTLAFHVDRERRHNGRNLLDAADVLRSPSWAGTRYAIGDHGDPVSGLLTAGRRPVRETLWADRWNTADSRLNGICRMFGIPQPHNLGKLATAIPGMTPGRVYWLHRHLADEEKWVREAIGEPRPTSPLPGECRACGHRALVVQTAGPEDAWTVVCGGRWDNGVHNPCLCLGAGCRCRMPGAVEGVAHIWLRSAVLGAVAGAAPTQP